MGSPLRIFVGMVALWLLGIWLGQLGHWSELSGFRVAEELQRRQALDVAWAWVRHRQAVNEHIVQRLLLGQLPLRQAVRELQILNSRSTGEEISELSLACNLVDLLASDPPGSLPNHHEVLKRLRRELTEMQQAGR